MHEQTISIAEYGDIINEIQMQPTWRSTADKEMDYANGNQLDSNITANQKTLGIPQLVDDLISPALLSIQGFETKTRTDWRVTPNGDIGGQDIADALSFELNKAERESHADRACSDAFHPQIACGVGFVEVTRNPNSFEFPYRCQYVHRNEIHWDMRAKETDLSDARWLLRQRWLNIRVAASAFPEWREKIESIGKGASWMDSVSRMDGGSSTGLQNAHVGSRVQTWLEEAWYNTTLREVCISELWYRRWVQVQVIKYADGRVEEFDMDNIEQLTALQFEGAQVSNSTVKKIRRSYWIGSVMLHDAPTPYPHNHFPYVPFFGFKEDMTGVYYGYVRGMKSPQDSRNAGISKLHWGMSVVRVTRTKGATQMTDAQLRQQISSRAADIVLDVQHMALPGAKFEVDRDYQLTDQHFKMIEESRAAIERVSGITASFMGERGTATSGTQEATQVEQSTQGLGRIMDNFRTARTQIGELLLALIIEDIGNKPYEVIIEGDAVKDDRLVRLNAADIDPVTGERKLTNDIQRTRLKVALEDVPSTNSYRAQQLNSMSEAIKSMPQEYQTAVLPFLVSLMDVPFKRDVVEALRAVDEKETPEQIDERIQQEVQDALQKAGNEIKLREIALKERIADTDIAKMEAEIKNIVAKAVLTGVQSAFSATQAAGSIATMPQLAPIADVIMSNAGYILPTKSDDPNLPSPEQAAMEPARTQIRVNADAPEGTLPENFIPNERQNTHPTFPPEPEMPATGEDGMQTATIADNVPTDSP